MFIFVLPGTKGSRKHSRINTTIHPGTELHIFLMPTRVVISSNDVTILVFSNFADDELGSFVVGSNGRRRKICCA